MSRRAAEERLLPANSKSVDKAIRETKKAAELREYRIEGARGLVLLVTAAGTATWYVHYDKAEGTKRLRRKKKLGRVDAVALGVAIDEAAALRPEIRRGADPARQAAAARAIPTFDELSIVRMNGSSPLRETTASDYKLVLKRDILPVIGHLPAEGPVGVTRQHVIGIMDRIAARGATRRADTARAVISTIYEHGKDRGLVHSNPAENIRKRHDYAPRDVVATRDQIRLLWLAIQDGTAAMDAEIADIVSLAMLVGQRRRETASLQTAEVRIDPQSPRLEFRRGMTKNHNRHIVPLGPQALTVVERALKRAGDSLWLFRGARAGRPIAPRSVSKAMQRTRDRLGIDDLTIHDLRRTMGTYMSQYGVPEEIRKRVLNHDGKRTGNITADVYDWYDHFEEKRAALELWGDAVEAIVSGAVVEIDRYETRLARYKGSERIRV